MKVSGILFPRGRACGHTQFGQLRSGVQARLYLFRESVDGFRCSGSFGCQSGRKPPAPVTRYPLAVTGSMMTGTSTACPLFSTQLRTRSFYTGDKRAGMESLGVQRLPSGQRNWPRDLNFYIMQQAKSLRQIDRKVRARNRCSGCTRAAPRLSRRRRGGEPDQAAPAFGEGLVPGLSRLRGRPAPGLAPQHQALAPDAGARLLRLRDEHQSPHPPPQGNVPTARAPSSWPNSPG